jgi:hypothetical protein
MKIGDRIKVQVKNSRYGWPNCMGDALGKFLRIKEIVFDDRCLVLENGYTYPMECFKPLVLKKAKVPKWKGIWKEE